MNEAVAGSAGYVRGTCPGLVYLCWGLRGTWRQCRTMDSSEPAIGLEPMTCCLQDSCSTN